jgi:hypothetical protein
MMTPLRMQMGDLPMLPPQGQDRRPFYDGLAIAAARSVTSLADLPAVADTLSGKISMTTYRAFLTETFHHVRHTVPLLRLTRARTQGAEEGIRRAVHQQFVEAWGYESLLLRDLANCGGDASATRLGRPAPATRRLIEFGYDWVETRNPLGMFGMIYALEATRAHLAAPAARAITTALGLGSEGLRYLSARAEAEQENLMVLERFIPQISAPSDQAAIAEVAEATFGLLAEFLEALPFGAAST